VSSTGVRALLAAAGALGVDAARVQREAGFDPAALADPDALLPAERFYAAFDIAARLWGRPGFGLAAGQAVPIGIYHVLDYLLLTASTLGEGLSDFVRYFAIATRTAAYEIRTEDDLTGCEMVWRIPPSGVMFDVRDWSLSAVARRVKEATGAAPCRVDVAGPPMAPPAEYERVLGAPTRLRAAGNVLWFTRRAWQSPMPRRDDWLRQTLRRHADALLERSHAAARESVSERVRREMLTRMRVGPPSIATVARSLGIGERTLQRQLRAEGAGFAQLADEVRSHLACEYLRDRTLTVAEVGYLLGFSEPSAFTRAFRRWTGQAPHAFREQATTGGR
jgi:AraC-like DNA-binding protein